MYRLSLIISEIYNKYLPLAEKDGIILNLDFSDTTKEISDPDRVKQYLDEHLGSAIKRSDPTGANEVSISVDKTAITITDTGTTLSHSACALLSNRYIDVSSRVGFGTTIKIFLQPRDPVTMPPSEPKPKLEPQSVAFGVALDNSQPSPTLQSEAQLSAKQGKHKLKLGTHLKLRGKSEQSQQSAKTSATKKSAKPVAKSKSSPKKSVPAKTKRQLALAAKKADKEVKRIAKKASKQAKKNTKAAKTSTKPAKATKPKSTKTTKSVKSTAKKRIKKFEVS